MQSPLDWGPGLELFKASDPLALPSPSPSPQTPPLPLPSLVPSLSLQPDAQPQLGQSFPFLLQTLPPRSGPSPGRVDHSVSDPNHWPLPLTSNVQSRLFQTPICPRSPPPAPSFSPSPSAALMLQFSGSLTPDLLVWTPRPRTHRFSLSNPPKSPSHPGQF